MSFWRSFRKRMAVVSPRRWRWQRFLRSLSIDPDRLERPVPQPSPRNFIICGLPRSGTTLLAAMLFQPPNVVTVMEPWDGMRLPPADLFSSLRDEIESTACLARGKLDVEALQADGEVRWRQEGEHPVQLGDMAAEYALGVKWPSFWRYIELLPQTRFLLCIRDPFEVVTSFKKQGGRLGEGLLYDIAFERAINTELREATDDLAVRRVLLYALISERIRTSLAAPNVYVVRYERWFQEPAALLSEVAAFLDVRLDKMPARVREGSGPNHLTRREIDLIREHAGIAADYGYDLGGAPAVA